VLFSGSPTALTFIAWMDVRPPQTFVIPQNAFAQYIADLNGIVWRDRRLHEDAGPWLSSKRLC
jgi:hypothetical protein